MAYAGCILPLYHGNEAETDLKPVGDVDERLFFRGLYLRPANLHCVNAADATTLGLIP
jgi:hypothetical protein